MFLKPVFLKPVWVQVLKTSLGFSEIFFFQKRFLKNFNFILCNFSVRTLKCKKKKKFFLPSWFINQLGGPPLDFINIQLPKRGSASRIDQHTAPKWGSASRIHQPKNEGSASRDNIYGSRGISKYNKHLNILSAIHKWFKLIYWSFC